MTTMNYAVFIVGIISAHIMRIFSVNVKRKRWVQSRGIRGRLRGLDNSVKRDEESIVETKEHAI